MSEFVDSDFIFVGRHYQEGKMYVAICQVKMDSTLAPERMFDFKNTYRNWLVGAVYRGATFSPTSVKGLADVRYVRTWDNRSFVIEAQARDTAAEHAQEARKLQSDAKKMESWGMAVLPYRRAYHAALRSGRMGAAWAIRDRLISELCRPLTKEEKE